MMLIRNYSGLKLNYQEGNYIESKCIISGEALLDGWLDAIDRFLFDRWNATIRTAKPNVKRAFISFEM